MESTLGKIVKLLIALGVYKFSRGSFTLGEFLVKFSHPLGGEQIRIRKRVGNSPIYEDVYTFHNVDGHRFVGDSLLEADACNILTVALLTLFPYPEDDSDFEHRDEYSLIGLRLPLDFLSKVFVGVSKDAKMLSLNIVDKPARQSQEDKVSSTRAPVEKEVQVEHFEEPDKPRMVRFIPCSLPSPYIPKPDEPSPFGTDGGWEQWAALQGPEFTQGHGESAFKTLLCMHLEKEAWRHQADLENVPAELLTGPGGHLSLGYVIHIRYAAGTTWQLADQYGRRLMTRERSRW